ncbi:thioesterase-like superfamily-domain-containing protein [Cunninghamella echinulata]|nr:thioesterase-like superfamily-domain-containing protein [Cunninghamella echinulata]
MSLSTQTTHFEFDKATITKYLGQSSTGSTIYIGQASKNWSIGNVPNGGYVVSLILDSVIQHYQPRHQKHPIALNCFFFNKTIPGSFVVEIEELKSSGKGYCICRASLKQTKNTKVPSPTSIKEYEAEEYTTKVHGIFTMGNMEFEKGRTFYHKNPKAPSKENMVPFQYQYMGDYVNAKMDLSTFPTSEKTGETLYQRPFQPEEGDTIVPGKPELSQALTFSDGRSVDYKSLALFADFMITPPFLLGSTYWNGPIWCPTMQLELQFKRPLSSSSNLKEVLVHFCAPHIINSRFDLDGEIYDTDGNVLAITKHQCLVVDWTRNISTKL